MKVDAKVDAVARDSAHGFSKPTVDQITLLAGLGVEGDTHAGVTVQHRSRVRRDPSQPNLRQVHLLPVEVIESLRARGYRVAPGAIGENITTRRIALLDLPTGTRLRLGADAVIEVTGLRNPCVQLERYQRGLMEALLDRDDHGGLVRLAGVMAIVLVGGVVRPGDSIAVELPARPHRALEPV